MEKKQKKSEELAVMMAQIQDRLVALDRKLDSFMGRTFMELAQLKAAKSVQRLQVSKPSPEKQEQKQILSRRPMFAIVCYQCGKDSELPFKPNGNRPVYCKSCFTEKKNRNKTVSTSQPISPIPSEVRIQKPVVKPAPPKKTSTKKVVSKIIITKKKVVKKAVVKETVSKKNVPIKKKEIVKKKAVTKKKMVAKKKIIVKKKATVKKKVAVKRKKK